MLAKDWITTPAIDLELKQYLLLAYLQQVERRFGEWKLYPHLNELRSHLQVISDWEQQKAAFISTLPQRLVGFNKKGSALEYRRAMPCSPELMQVIEEVMHLAEPRLKRSIAAGQQLKDEVLSHIEMRPIGLIPLRKDEGYLLLHQPLETRVYGFNVGSVQLHGSSRMNIRTRYVTSFASALQWHPGRIRLQLIEKNRELPEPLTMMINSDIPIPCVETFMPIARQMVYEFVVAHRQEDGGTS